MNDNERQACERAIERMQAAADDFYPAAVRTNLHRFVEFAGLLREFVSICRDELDRDLDFFTREGKPAPYRMAYVAEKIDCIYGHAAPHAVAAFVGALAAHGWPVGFRPPSPAMGPQACGVEPRADAVAHCPVCGLRAHKGDLAFPVVACLGCGWQRAMPTHDRAPACEPGCVYCGTRCCHSHSAEEPAP